MEHSSVGAGGGPSAGEITSLLQRWRQGESGAIEALVPMVHDQLKRLARSYLRAAGPHQTLQPTELVDELFVRILGWRPGDIQDRHHFYALAAKILRQVLVDQARARGAGKRGGGVCFVDTRAAGLAASAPAGVELLDLERALASLRARDPGLERLVELRFFAGLTIDESASVLERSVASVNRDWTAARAFLFRELQGSARSGEPAPSP